MSSIAHNPRGRHAVVVSSVFTALAFIVVALRLYTRFFLVRSPGTEDYGIILAMLCSVGLTICIGFQTQYGLGQHIHDLEGVSMQKTLKAFWGSLIVYYLSLGMTKGSMLLQYRRVFTTKRFWIGNYAVMAVVVAYTFWTVFSSIFACVPIRAFWTREPARCLNQFAMWFTNAAINILTDFAIIILPMPVIRKLNLDRRQKTALIAIFAVGGVVCVVSILRLQSLVSISNSSDPTYDNPPAATWSSVEVNVGIICSCLPLLRPLMIRWLPDAMSSHKRSMKSKQKMYAMMGNGKRKGPSSYSGMNLDSIATKQQSGTTIKDFGWDIQVITDIQVDVEGGSGRLSMWPSPTTTRFKESGKEERTKREVWHDDASAKDMREQMSTESLV
ncbi:hypothetical protein ACN47E_008370 [Coniothyrium glycines]